MTVSEAGISLTAPCWADPTLHCLPAILRTEQVKPASHGCSQVVKERLAQGLSKLDHVGANGIDITGGCDSGFHLVAEPADKLADLPAHELAQSVMDDQFFCHVRVSVFRIGLVRLLRLTSPIRPGFSPGGAPKPLLSFQRQPVTSHFSDCTLVDCRESFQGSAAEAAGPVAGVMSPRAATPCQCCAGPPAGVFLEST